MTTYEATLDNPKETPWFIWIEEGIKTYEGRLYNSGTEKEPKIWTKIKVGDTITNIIKLKLKLKILKNILILLLPFMTLEHN